MQSSVFEYLHMTLNVKTNVYWPFWLCKLRLSCFIFFCRDLMLSVNLEASSCSGSTLTLPRPPLILLSLLINPKSCIIQNSYGPRLSGGWSSDQHQPVLSEIFRAVYSKTKKWIKLMSLFFYCVDTILLMSWLKSCKVEKMMPLKCTC